MSALIIEIPSSTVTAQTPLRYVLTVDGQSADRSGSATATLLPKPTRTTKVVLVLPVQALSWHRVQWPQKVSLKDRQRSLAVLNGLLEDQLLDDPRTLHMALAPDAAPGQACWVCVCHKAWLEAAVQTLAQAGVNVGVIAPALSPTAAAKEGAVVPQFYAFGSAESPWLSIAPTDAEGSILTVPLNAAAAQLDFIAHSPPETEVLAEPAVFQLSQQMLHRPAQLLEQGRYLLQAAQTPWNLAQFQFANASKDRLAQGISGTAQALLRAPQWRWVRIGVVLVVAAQIIGLNVGAWQAKRNLQAKRQAIEEIFRSTFPQVPVVLDAPLQMQREVAALEQRSGALTPGAFEALSAQVGVALQQSPAGASVPTGIQYENQTLSLVGLSMDEPALRAMQEALAAQRLTLTVAESSDANAPAPLLKITPLRQGVAP